MEIQRIILLTLLWEELLILLLLPTMVEPQMSLLIQPD